MSEREVGQILSWARLEGAEDSPRNRAKLHNFLELLSIWSARVALVGRAELPLLTRKHLADSLYAAGRVAQRGRLADFGSGGGLPGIPIAIVRPELQVDLIESQEKKISFLKQASATVANATPRQMRIEDVEPRTYDLAITRALAPLDRLLPLLQPAMKDSGTLWAMKSATWTEELAGGGPENYGFKLEDAHSYVLPTGEERTLLRLTRSR